jgi:hypothetical protein
MRTLAAAIALALLCACAGYTNGSPVGGGPDGGVGLDQDSGPDGGADAGDGGDAGPDAGCVPLSLNVAAIDSCAFISPTTTTASVSVTGPAQGCAVNISLATGSSPCLGVATHGTLDAFDGGCTGIGLLCTSPSLPGTLTCTTSTGTCTIRICDAGVCSP